MDSLSGSYNNYTCQTGDGEHFNGTERSRSGPLRGLIAQFPCNPGFGS